jgi:hypothetical protein
MLSNYEIHWSPTIGDPTIMGWITVACYFFCSVLCLKVFRHGTMIFDHPVKRQQFLWLALFALTFLLGINKQLDLQSLFTEIGKYYAYNNGLYEHRRAFQEVFIKLIAGSAFISLATLIYLYRGVVRYHFVAIAGFCFLAAFVLIRASSFHNVDLLIKTEIAGFRLNWLFELFGLGLIAFNALILGRAIAAQQDTTRATARAS